VFSVTVFKVATLPWNLLSLGIVNQAGLLSRMLTYFGKR
jgi:hypothetical protein